MIVFVVPVFAQGGCSGYQGRVASGDPGAAGERRRAGRRGKARMCHGRWGARWHRATRNYCHPSHGARPAGCCGAAGRLFSIIWDEAKRSATDI